MLSYLVFYLTMATILAIATLGLNLQWGLAGQFNAGIAGFFCLGGYALAILTVPASSGALVRPQLPLWAGLLGSMVCCCAGAVLVAWLTSRLRGDHFAIATFAIAGAIQLLAVNLDSLTGGSRGLVGIPHPFAPWPEAHAAWGYLALVAALAVALAAALEALRRSPWGRTLRAIRDDEAVCSSCGKDVARMRRTAFSIGAALMGLAGALQAAYIGAVSPSDFLPIVTLQIWTMLVVGGAGGFAGAFLGSFVVWGIWTLTGAALVYLLPAELQLQGGALQSIIIGSVLVAVLVRRPEGVMGRKSSERL